ncbi:Formiminotetrahydrofolate cyclodeaminase [Halalkaliarchaeum sp. AArc-CO]|uniref:cyclodeaminase/cyclohydrolase family protein n=1 Tax=Halalkaliarchaeum sp. AArc-CO TaxID=2866381 RepID=UPI00217F15DB|nr:cyclodeaminase/cyclohydrolase family protein [Halalkaliarchaeum sp. AArc-CO]UWG50811.1 Formiminotetrahydrofolate cyclodeaminase [Halalkaliarchaeum sp. AArc-CO]
MNYAEEPIGEFLEAVASERVVPAGGTAAAIVGAAGAALCEMTCIHAEHAPVERPTAETELLAEARAELRRSRVRLLQLGDADAEAIEALRSVVRGADTDSEETTTEERRATGVPLTIAEACLSVLEAAEVAVELGAENATPDAVTGVLLAESALESALYIVRHNTADLENDSFAGTVRNRAAEIDTKADYAVECALADIDVAIRERR